MIIVASRKNVERIYAHYPSNGIAVFNLGSNNAADKDGKIELPYKTTGILPSDDVINSVIEGHEKPKKVIKEAVKALMFPTQKPKKGMSKVAFGMGILLNMINDNADVPDKKSKKQMKAWEKRHAPNIICFVLPETDESMDKKARKRYIKFLRDYVAAVFNAFGLETMCDVNKKDFKQFYKHCFGKKKKKNAVTMRRFIEERADEGTMMSTDGYDRFQAIRIFYSCEYLQLTLDNKKDDLKMNRSNVDKLGRHLLSCFTGGTVLVMEQYLDNSYKPKFVTKNLVNMMKKNKMIVDAYNECNEILTTLGKEFTMPKAIYGNTKKSRKKYMKSGDADKLVPKMKVKKFKKFFSKSDNRPLMRIVYGHIAARLIGTEVGTHEYSRTMTNTISIDLPSDFAKTYVLAAKKWAKDKAALKAEKKAKKDAKKGSDKAATAE